MNLRRTYVPLVSILAALTVSGGCTDAAPSDNDTAVGDTAVGDTAVGDTAVADVSADAPHADADTIDSSVDAPAADATPSDIAPDVADSNPDVEDGVPANFGEPDIDLESVAGHRVQALTYVVPGLEEERSVDVRMWHATADEEGERTYFALDIFSDAFAWDDASVLPPPVGEMAPLVVYSHGGRGFSGQISTVARQFVRNGWVFVAPSHPGDILTDVDVQQPYSFTVLRAFDVMAAIDYVENLPEEHPLSGRVDTSRVLVMGHSYGGQNAWILAGLPLNLDGIRERCGEGCTPADIAAYEAFSPDPRVVAGVSLENTMDPNTVPDAGFAEVQTPMLHISGTEGNDATELFSRAAEANLTWVSLLGGCHESPTGTLPCATLPRDEGLRLTSTFTVAFATRHVLASTDPSVAGILDGSVEVSSSAAVLLSPGSR